MSANTNVSVPDKSNPSSLKSRYEIRKLEKEHLPWVSAIVIHSNLFHSPVWPALYPNNVTERLHKSFEAAEYLCMHQINSGLSFGVFDTQYQYKRPESKDVGGKLYWDKNEKSIQEDKGLKAEGDRLLEQMDFPLVSVALSYDAYNALDMEQMGPIMACLPHFGLIYHILHEKDQRDPTTWQPNGTNEVIFRNATSTRHDYEGEKLMTGLARWLMREADRLGFRGIQIECVHDAVTHVWSNPEPPYKAIVASQFHTGTYKDEEGKIAFEPVQQRITKCYVDLKPKA